MKVWIVTKKFESNEAYFDFIDVNVFDSYDKAYEFMTSVFNETVKDNMDTYRSPDYYVIDKNVFENYAFYTKKYLDEYISYEWLLDEREVN